MSYVLQVALRIRKENVDAFMKKVLENAAHARHEPGCRHFDVLVDPKDPTQAMLYEIYDDEAAFVAHQATDHFKRYIAEAVPLLEFRERRVWQLAAG
jgi:quinol monooxygenase YgiN